MNGKITLYIGLLVIGIAVLGAGLWFLFNPLQVSSIEIPEGPPVIAMDKTFTMAGTSEKLYIYENGTVVYLKETGMRPGQTRIEIWNKGLIGIQELDTIINFIREVKFSELEESYSYQDTPSSDLQYMITVKYQDISKTVASDGYFAPDSDLPYPKLPYPLDEIYTKLMNIINSKTEEVYRETN